jgi:hypothetical protein
LGKRRYRRRIEKLEEMVREHQQKIGIERAKDKPNEGLIGHWEKEIRAFLDGIKKANKRLGKKA